MKNVKRLFESFIKLYKKTFAIFLIFIKISAICNNCQPDPPGGTPGGLITNPTPQGGTPGV